LQVQATTLPPNRQLDAQRKIRHWYWASVFTNRYSGSVESTAARDFLDVTSWFEDDVKEPPVHGELRQRFRTLDLRKEVRRGTSVYNGIFNLLVLRGARDWMTGNAPQYGDLDDHHIVPKDWRKNHPDVGTPYRHRPQPDPPSRRTRIVMSYGTDSRTRTSQNSSQRMARQPCERRSNRT
jgi:hypothetical protein